MSHEATAATALFLTALLYAIWSSAQKSTDETSYIRNLLFVSLIPLPFTGHAEPVFLYALGSSVLTMFLLTSLKFSLSRADGGGVRTILSDGFVGLTIFGAVLYFGLMDGPVVVGMTIGIAVATAGYGLFRSINYIIALTSS